jgi:hypothetical protein
VNQNSVKNNRGMFTGKKRELRNMELLTPYTAQVSQLPWRDKFQVLRISDHDIQNSHGS